MKQFAWIFSAFALIVLMTIAACTNPTEIGADLLQGDKAEVGFTDTLSVIATTVKRDTVLTYFPIYSISDAFTSYLCGDMRDPIFGKSKSQVYAQVSLTEYLPDFPASTIIDSIVLELPYDTVGLYGNLKENYGISVLRLTEAMDPNLNYYSNASFATDPMELGSKQFIPNLDSVTVFDYASGIGTDTLKVGPELRIPLNLFFARELVDLDTSYYTSDSAFVSYFKGIKLQPTTINNGMLSFNLLDSRAGIYLYYTESDTIKRQLEFQFNPYRARVVQMDNDPTNAYVERYINNTELGDSLVFVQGMTGLNTKLEIPYVNKLKGLVVNKAELEVRIANLPGDDLNAYAPVPQILMLAPDDSGNLVTIDDVSILLSQGTDILKQAYGGVPEDGKPGEPMVYKINISSHFQGMIDGRNPNVLYMSVFNRAQLPARVPLFGAKAPQYAIKLKVAFTRL